MNANGRRHGDNTIGNWVREHWWRYWADRPELYTKLKAMPEARCLVTARVSKHLVLSFQPTDRIFSDALYVFPLPAFTAFAVLQSRVHEPWARLLSSSMKTDLRYAASDCFETFPFPEVDPRAVISTLEAAGKTLYEARATYMVETQRGLTKTYNALKDPACEDTLVLALRRLHEAMDRAVLDAYGWTDVTVPPYCALNDEDRARQQAFEDEVIDRLYVLNAARAKDEGTKVVSAKAAVEGEKAPAKKSRKKSGGKKEPEQGELF